MAWNLPEDQKKPKSDGDPWTDRPKDNKQPGEQQPPHLEAILRDYWLKLKRSWGKRPSLAPRRGPVIKSLVGLLGVVWLIKGAHYVNADQLAYVMRFGTYQGQLAPGWQWRAWGLYQVHLLPQPIKISVVSEVMTQDLNLAKLTTTLTYRVIDPKAYLFSLAAPTDTLAALADSALQQTVGHVKLASLLSEKNPPAVERDFKALSQIAFDQAGLGVKVDTVSIDNVAIPDTLQELFNKMNALYVTQTTEKQKNAEYQQQVLPPALLKAQAGITEAKAYADRVKQAAEVDVADFLSILPRYEKAPQLVKHQLYTQSMTTILSESSTVVVDAKGSSPMIVINDQSVKKAPSATAVNAPVVEEPVSNEPDSYGNVKGGYG